MTFYQEPERQREVIQRLQSNPNIAAVLAPPSPGAFSVDGIPSKDRAPLVWAYIEQNFAPDFQRGDVVFWRRKK